MRQWNLVSTSHWIQQSTRTYLASWNKNVRKKKNLIFFIAAGKQTPQCYPSSVTSARTMMLFNLGSAYCLRSEYDKARKCLHQVWKTNLKAALGTNVLPSKCHWDHSKFWWFYSPGFFADPAEMVTFFCLYEQNKDICLFSIGIKINSKFRTCVKSSVPL